MHSLPSILFLRKEGDQFASVATEILAQADCRVDVFDLRRGERIPPQALSWQGDFIISYLCPAVVPCKLLDRASLAAINFHNGPPEYPGIGCVNFAIYDDSRSYGATCHHMSPAVDSGNIIKVRRFDVAPVETVWTLLSRTNSVMFELFCEISPFLIHKRTLPSSPERWTRSAFRRKQLEALCRLDRDMASGEIDRRVRATTFPGAPGAYFEIGGRRVPHDEINNQTTRS